MSNRYETKLATRKELLKNRAARLRALAEAKHKEAHKMADCIPFGQPILVGHHSEGRDRRFRRRITKTFTVSLTLSKKAEELEQRAERVGRRGISADDPAAIQKLEHKLQDLEQQQKLMKDVNRAHAAYLKNSASLEKSTLAESHKERIRNYKPAYSWEPHPFAPYELQNNNAEIRRVKSRIETLKQEAVKAEELEQAHGEPAIVTTFEHFELREDHTENRVMFIFPGKPAPEIREALKRHGFRWSPSRSAWVRQLNEAGRWAARQVSEKLANL